MLHVTAQWALFRCCCFLNDCCIIISFKNCITLLRWFWESKQLIWPVCVIQNHLMVWKQIADNLNGNADFDAPLGAAHFSFKLWRQTVKTRAIPRSALLEIPVDSIHNYTNFYVDIRVWVNITKLTWQLLNLSTSVFVCLFIWIRKQQTNVPSVFHSYWILPLFAIFAFSYQIRFRCRFLWRICHLSVSKNQAHCNWDCR